ncbi:MAG: spondin domain-containing protein [Psychromonas sp.]
MKYSTIKQFLLLTGVAVILSACSDNDDNNGANVNNDDAPTITSDDVVMDYQYQVTVTNLTHGQPFSPPTLIVNTGAPLWEVGQPASLALEKLAESGDSSDLLSSFDQTQATSVVSTGPLLPGNSVDLSLSISEQHTYLHLLTMLVNTNDAFSGLTNLDISELALNETTIVTLGVYDAGTEENSELAGTIPGPADSGTGFETQRDDTDKVSVHAGVVTSDDGLLQSVLTQADRFDNPAMKLTITRIK